MAATVPLKNHPPWKEWMAEADLLKDAGTVPNRMIATPLFKYNYTLLYRTEDSKSCFGKNISSSQIFNASKRSSKQ